MARIRFCVQSSWCGGKIATCVERFQTACALRLVWTTFCPWAMKLDDKDKEWQRNLYAGEVVSPMYVWELKIETWTGREEMGLGQNFQCEHGSWNLVPCSSHDMQSVQTCNVSSGRFNIGQSVKIFDGSALELLSTSWELLHLCWRCLWKNVSSQIEVVDLWASPPEFLESPKGWRIGLHQIQGQDVVTGVGDVVTGRPGACGACARRRRPVAEATKGVALRRRRGHVLQELRLHPEAKLQMCSNDVKKFKSLKVSFHDIKWHNGTQCLRMTNLRTVVTFLKISVCFLSWTLTALWHSAWCCEFHWASHSKSIDFTSESLMPS